MAEGAIGRELPGVGAVNSCFIEEAFLGPSAAADTSTKFKYYKGLKLKSKSHFYGRAAADEVLANRLSALLRPRMEWV